MSSSLEQLKASGTVVVCDSGDFATIGKYKPQDATTNPSLILAASKKPEYAALIDAAVAYGKTKGKTVDEQVEATLDRLLVEFGKKILEIIPGKVSTEVDAKLSFDTQGSVNKALEIIKLYEENGISKDRILIKIASTWEGIKAAHILQSQHGINCNLTLMFSLVQAIAAAEAGAFLISPSSVVSSTGTRTLTSVTTLPRRTLVSSPSRTSSTITRSTATTPSSWVLPSVTPDLFNSTAAVPKKLDSANASSLDIPKRAYLNDEPSFRFDFNEETMAVEKLREGISKFAADAITLKDLLKAKIQA
ncbi:hypothetical protein N7450_006056 [Penicillium hetheringtonii]|uniref:Transaldolase n=1 Tax=Penicillium hetheringtonii TaxID=911720 RepID=A0AAD6GSJ0_9EURO|nr:hypothetical protein N7450_006056 [Penicillium hetheringtonii]